MNKTLSLGSSLLVISLFVAKLTFGSLVNEKHHHVIKSFPDYYGWDVKDADTLRLVKGKVISAEDGQPIAGVSVTVKDGGGTIGAITDQDGHFSLKVPQGTTRIIFSAVGYQKQEVILSGLNVYNISLQYLAKGLEEVTVVAYGKQKLSSYTGSLGELNPDSYEKVPRENVMESIQGNVSGVRISKGDGQAGSPVSIQIRGKGSIINESSPLYVVDGVPIDVATGVDYRIFGGYTTSGLAGIDPEDIAGVTVLKDAAATSLYGSRAANGVILITTKKGKAGKTRLHLSVQQGRNKIGLLKRGLPLNTTEMLELLREGYANAGNDVSQFPELLKTNDIDTTQYTDWVDALTRTGNFGKYYLSMSGGSDKTQFLVSGGYENSQGTLGKLDYKKGTARISVKSQLLDRLTINGDLSAYYQRTANTGATFGWLAGPVGALYQMQPWLKIYNDDGTFNLGFNSTYNPIAVQEYSKNVSTATNVTGTVSATLELIKGLNFETRENFLITYGLTDIFSPDWFGWGRNYGGIGEYHGSVRKSWVTSNILRYNHTFGDKHYIEALAGYEAQNVMIETQYAEGEQYLPGIQWMSGASYTDGNSSDFTQSSVVGSFFNLQYHYDENYFVNASVRRDGSSRFGPKRRYGTFWSVGAGWNIKGTLLKNVKPVSALKLRSSYGVNGSQDLGNFDYASVYGTGYDYSGSPGFVFAQFANPLLTWEQNAPFDIGIDFGFLDNRIFGSIDYYSRITSRLLLARKLPSTSGLTTFTDNYGKMKNSGVEISLSTRNIVAKGKDGLNWTTEFNISTVKNKILYIPTPTIGTATITETGSSFYTWYLPAYAGADPQTGVQLWYTDEKKTQTSTNYNDAIRLKMGSAFPDFYGGLKNTFTYHNFDFSFLLYADWGRKIFSNHPGLESDGSGAFTYNKVISRYSYDNRWQKPGDITDAPKIVYKGHAPEASSSRWLWDGSYIRLRDVTLGYTLPQQAAKKIGLQKVAFYIQGSNLALYVPDKHVIYDPETGPDGILDLKTPINRSIVLGVGIDF